MEIKIKELFSEIKEPRVAGRCSHNLCDILTIALCTLLADGEDFEDMVVFGKEKESLLRTFLELPNGIPSHDTFNRVFQLLDYQSLDACLGKYGRTLLDFIAEKQICLDGKKLRGTSPTLRGNQGLYLLSAWVSENKICLGQRKVEDKSNEITAIPLLLEQIDITDSTVSIDAIGCQKSIAELICSKKGNYFLAVKGNQKTLYEELIAGFEQHQAITGTEEWEYNHGRFEQRQCSILSAKEVLSPDVLNQWKSIEIIIKIVSKRTIKNNTTTEVRYYISNEKIYKPNYFNKLGRGHWSIENDLHWHLDVTFNEDACRARTKNAPINLSTIRKLGLFLLNQNNENLSLKKRRYKAALNDDYLLQLIGF